MFNTKQKLKMSAHRFYFIIIFFLAHLKPGMEVWSIQKVKMAIPTSTKNIFFLLIIDTFNKGLFADN